KGVVKDAAPAGWYIGKGTRRELYRVDGTRSRSGSACLRVDAGEPVGWMSIGHFPTLEGKEYEFSGWILTEQTAAWDLCTVYFYADAAKILSEAVHLKAPADQPWWTPLRVRLKVPAGAKSFQIMVTQGFPKGTMWVDDLSLRALDTGEEIVVNGAFER
ncbi:MAG TPA: hypothetical protein VJB14_15280, partial [Planctomycetota bacterium]|nr:hypothetical protein [Planctomycetota bacterium]